MDVELCPSSPCRDLLPASGEKGAELQPLASFSPSIRGEGGGSRMRGRAEGLQDATRTKKGAGKAPFFILIAICQAESLAMISSETSMLE